MLTNPTMQVYRYEHVKAYKVVRVGLLQFHDPARKAQYQRIVETTSANPNRPCVAH